MHPWDFYASSGDAYSDRQLTPNFEFWPEIFCVSTCFHMMLLKSSLSVRTPTKEITLASSILVLQCWLIHQWNGLYKNYSMGTQNFIFLFLLKKCNFLLDFDLYFFLLIPLRLSVRTPTKNNFSFINVFLKKCIP